MGTDDLIPGWVLDTVFSVEVSVRHKTLSRFLKSQKKVISSDTLTQIQRTAEAQLLEQGKQYAYLMFHLMTITNQWGTSGKDAVCIGFCRTALSVPYPEPITISHIDQLNEIVTDMVAQYRWGDLTVPQIKSQLKSTKINLLGHQFSLLKVHDLNRALAMLEMKIFIASGITDEYPQLSICEGTRSELGMFTIYDIVHEIINSPNIIDIQAATIGDFEIYMRRPTITMLYYQKWMYSISDPPSNLATAPERNISQGIKTRCLLGYGVRTISDLEKVRDMVKRELYDTILCHELGHGVFQNHLFPSEKLAVIASTKHFKNAIFDSLGEALADLVPACEGGKGPFQNFVDIAKTDAVRATRMFYMYMSDTWFFDTTDSQMYQYSDIIMLVMLRYITPDKIDFEKMAEDIQCRPDPADPITLVEKIGALMVSTYDAIHQIYATATYRIMDKPLILNDIKILAYQNYKKQKMYIDERSYRFLLHFWLNVAGCLATYAPDSQDKMNTLLARMSDKIMGQLFILTAGRQTAETYANNYRGYIFDRCIELGITAETPAPYNSTN